MTSDLNQIKIYTCGPTVYNSAHIGNLRAFVFADLVYRAKKFAGANPKWVMNITDVDDKTIKNTIAKFGNQAETTELKKYTEEYTKVFLSDLEKLNVLTNEINFVKVSDVIPDIQNFIVKLIEKNYAYKAEDGSTYFNIEKYQQDFGHYGELVGEKFLEGKKIGGSTSPSARVKADEYTKDDVNDFALWKARTSEDGEVFWDHPLLGEGRPGWHIECSAINYREFGDQSTNIHTGGIDLIFPHHTNEIAQSEALTGHKFVETWLHSEHVLIDGKKMSKSLGNIYTLKDIEQKNFSPLAYRYLLLQTSYKQKVNFTWDSLESAQKGYDNLKKKIAKIAEEAPASRGESSRGRPEVSPREAPEVTLRKTEDYLSDFTSKINQLNTASALASLQSVISSHDISATQKLELIAKFDEVLGLKII